VISPYEVMTMYQEIVDPAHTFRRLAEEDLGEVARAGRSNCALDTTRLESKGIYFPPVRNALADALRSLAQNLPQAETPKQQRQCV
jgi:hypothetical protein